MPAKILRLIGAFPRIESATATASAHLIRAHSGLQRRSREVSRIGPKWPGGSPAVRRRIRASLSRACENPRMHFELQPTLRGELVTLRPLRADDWGAVYAAGSDPLIWEQHPYRDRYKEPEFREYFRGAMDSGGAFAVLDRKTGEVIGCTRFYNLDETASQIEIGWTFLVRS